MTVPGTITLVELQTLIADSKGEWEHNRVQEDHG